MNNCNDMGIDTNEVLLRLVQPYSDSYLERLRTALLEVPELRVVHVWNGFHLDDMEVNRICEDSKINYVFEQMEFPDVIHAAIYVCKNQLKRSDLSIEYKKYLIGQRYLYEYMIATANKPSESKYGLAAAIAPDSYISAGTVLKYSAYATAMNAIFDQDTAFAKSILSGKLRLSHANTIELSRLRPDEIRAVAKSSIEEKIDHITLSYIRNEVKWSHIQPKNQISRRERSEERARNRVTIRQMPEYDPDAEVNSLCLTIDSWISSMQRVKGSDNFPRITKMACLRLMKKLSVLEHTINQIQESLVERTSV